MSQFRKLPIGIEDFEEIRSENFYYVDKTKLIEQLLDKWGKVNLFTRPRRFGKSLNMSMLQRFFEIGADPGLFEGLYISQNRELCETYMGKFPVICISLKGVNAGRFEEARSQLIKVVNREARRLQFLSESKQLTSEDRRLFKALLDKDMDSGTLASGLQELSELLSRHYDRKVLILIDEYDVPLAKANEQGFYDEMVFLLRNFFENALKTNEYLKFAVLTGCLRVAKESIFTGLNNFKVNSITDVDFDEYFGFTNAEVKAMLHYYHQDEHYAIVKEWYDGYRFGQADVYCPWDVINYCDSHISAPELPPANYWLNTSGNDMIRYFIDQGYEEKQITKSELEQLVNGGIVQKEIHLDLTYKELYASMENIWSALFMTGYLTQRGRADGNRYNLVIPNREVRNIVTEHIMNLFKADIAKDGEMVNNFCNALANGQADKVAQIFTDYMKRTISVRDTFVRRPTKENFYHGLILGILSFKGGWMVDSNKEAGDGYSDIIIRIDEMEVGIIIEVKYSEDEDMNAACQKALVQIDSKHYDEAFLSHSIKKVLKYGIVCSRKKCCVLVANN